MTDRFDPEFSIPKEQTFCPETAAPPAEIAFPASENAAPAPEFFVPPAGAGSSPDNARGETQKSSAATLLKRMLITTAAASVAAVSIVMASFGNDPLGRDFLSHDEYWHDEEYNHEPWDDHQNHSNNGGKNGGAFVEPEDPSDGTTVRFVHLTLKTPDGVRAFEAPGITEDEIDYYYAQRAQYLWEEAYNDMLVWLEKQGGDASTLKLVNCELKYLKTVESDDYLAVGDEDDQNNEYVMRGSKVKLYRKDLYYTAELLSQKSTGETQRPPYSDRDSADDVFPRLTNLEPNGYITDGNGAKIKLNQEFVRIESEDVAVWIVAGDAYGIPVTEPAGVSYDADTNTLTLENFTGGVLNVNMMGNGFKLKLVGDNHLDGILVWGYYYGGSLTVIGPGSLTVNENRKMQIGIRLEAEASESCLIIDQTVERLEVFGGSEAVNDGWQQTTAAILVKDTTLEKGIWYLSPLRLNLPTYRFLRSSSDDGTLIVYTYSLSNGFYTDELPEGYGDVARHVIFSQNGDRLTDEEEYRDYLEHKKRAGLLSNL